MAVKKSLRTKKRRKTRASKKTTLGSPAVQASSESSLDEMMSSPQMQSLLITAKSKINQAARNRKRKRDQEDEEDDYVPNFDEESESDYNEDLSEASSIEPEELSDNGLEWDDLEAKTVAELKKKGKPVQARTAANKSKGAAKPSKKAGKGSTLIRVEPAKSGRASCRRCKVKIQAGETRIGLEAWIMGRQAVTWQHPKCFAEGIHFSPSPSARGSCKFSGERFEKGETRLGLTSHTTKSYVKIEHASAVLEDFVKTTKLNLTKVEGFKSLDAKSKKSLQQALG